MILLVCTQVLFSELEH